MYVCVHVCVAVETKLIEAIMEGGAGEGAGVDGGGGGGGSG